MKRYTEEEARAKCGNELVDKVLSEGVEPTSRLIYPAFDPTDHIGKSEFSNCVSDEKYKLTVYFYLTEEEEQDLDLADWSKGEFEIEENEDE